MRDRTGLKTALASIGYYLSENIDNDIELYCAGREGKKFALILLDNRCDVVKGRGAVERIFEMARNGRVIQGHSDWNIFMIITDICKDRNLTGIKNVLYLNESDYSLKGNRIDNIFSEDVRNIKKLLRCLQLEKLHSRNEVGMAKSYREHRVILTPLLIILNIAIYILCHDKNDIYGISKDLLDRGQYYRMLTYAFMHTGVIHLAVNMISLGLIGKVLEKQIGWIKMLFVYIAAVIVGAEMSTMFTSSPATITVGASGAICGLIAANIVSIAFLPMELHGSAITNCITWLLTILVYGTFRNVDNICHMGGALGGALAMLILAFASQTIFLGNIEEANRYHASKLNEIKRRMYRYDGSRDNNPNIYLWEER